MTAEVAIMNTHAIALAADSAVTLGIGKTYNTADKLFALSKYHPVGIMINGSARMMNVDWEVIVKCYRDQLGNKSFDKLTDYTGDFINYLEKFSYFTPEQMIEYLESMCISVFAKVLAQFINDLHAEFDGKENIELSQIDAVFDTTLKNIKEEMGKAEDEKQIKPDFAFIDSNHETVKEILGMVFEKYELSKKQITKLKDILKLNFQKCFWMEHHSGIVIAGYGEREIFPTLCEFNLSGKLGESLIYMEYNVDQIGKDHTASICPFAQTEMVHQFVKGIDPYFSIIIENKVETILSSLAPLINDPDKEKTSAISDILTEYISGIVRNVYIDPIIKIVACMEKSELVLMAEAMVNLTALRRHVSTDDETVGGPIDVALITKGEGFIWIKRKTNYDPHLNRDLNQNYFRS